MEVIRCASQDEFAEQFAFFVGSLISTRTKELHIALAGGSTPAYPYRILAQKALEFTGVQWYQVDERYVPAESMDANQRMIREAFDVAVPFLFHAVQTELPLEEACRAYAEVLPKEPFDIAVLGIGTDGHIASLFPGTEMRAENVFATTAPDGSPRVTLHERLLVESRIVVVLLSGESKKEILDGLINKKKYEPRLPMEALYGCARVVVITEDI